MTKIKVAANIVQDGMSGTNVRLFDANGKEISLPWTGIKVNMELDSAITADVNFVVNVWGTEEEMNKYLSESK